MKTKFRGFSERLNKWVYGYLVEDCMIVNGIVEANDQYISIESWEPVVPESVGQYTGEKDAEGTEIYKGDEIHVSVSKYIDALAKARVVFYNGSFGVIGDLQGYGYDDGFYSLDTIIHRAGHSVTVCGNIYQNKELLEGE